MSETIASRVCREVDECIQHVKKFKQLNSKISFSMSAIRNLIVSVQLQHVIKEKQFLLAIEKSVELYFALIDNDDQGIRALAEECLDSVLQFLLISLHYKLTITCLLHQLKLMSPARSTAAAFTRLSTLFHFVNRDDLEFFVIELFPVMSKMIQRTDESIHQSLLANLNDLFNVIKEAMWNKNIVMLAVQLYEAALLGIDKRGTAGRTAVLIIELLSSTYTSVFDLAFTTCVESIVTNNQFSHAHLIGRLNILKSIWSLVVEEQRILPEINCIASFSKSDFCIKVLLYTMNLLGSKNAETIVASLELVDKICKTHNLLSSTSFQVSLEFILSNIDGQVDSDKNSYSGESLEEKIAKTTMSSECESTIYDPLIFPDAYDEMNLSSAKEEKKESAPKIINALELFNDVCVIEDSEPTCIFYVASVIAKRFLLRGLHGYAKDNDIRVSHKMMAFKCLTTIAENQNLSKLSVRFGSYKQHLSELRSFLQHQDDHLFAAAFNFLIKADIPAIETFVDCQTIIQAISSGSLIRQKVVVQSLIGVQTHLSSLQILHNIVQDVLNKSKSQFLSLSVTCMDFLTHINWKNISPTDFDADRLQKAIIKQCLRIIRTQGILVYPSIAQWLQLIANNFYLTYDPYVIPRSCSIKICHNPSINQPVLNLSKKYNLTLIDKSDTVEESLHYFIACSFQEFACSLEQESLGYLLDNIVKAFPPSVYSWAWGLDTQTASGYIEILLNICEVYARSASSLSYFLSVLSSLYAAQCEMTVREILKDKNKVTYGKLTGPSYLNKFLNLSLKIFNLYHSIMSFDEQSNSLLSSSKFSPLPARKIIAGLTDKKLKNHDDTVFSAQYTNLTSLTGSLADGLRGAYKNYSSSLHMDHKSKFFQLLVQATESLNVIMEMLTFEQLNPFLDELLAYMKVFFTHIPETMIPCLHQVFKVVFNKNLMSVPLENLSIHEDPVNNSKVLTIDECSSCSSSVFSIGNKLTKIEINRYLGWLRHCDPNQKDQSVPRKRIGMILSKLEFFVTKLRHVNFAFFSVDCRKAILRLFTELTRVGLIYQDIDPKLGFFHSVTKQCRKARPSFWIVVKEVVQYLVVLSHVPESPFSKDDLERLGQYLLQEANPENMDLALNAVNDIVLYNLFVTNENCITIKNELFNRAAQFYLHSTHNVISMITFFACKETIKENCLNLFEQFIIFYREQLSVISPPDYSYLSIINLLESLPLSEKPCLDQIIELLSLINSVGVSSPLLVNSISILLCLINKLVKQEITDETRIKLLSKYLSSVILNGLVGLSANKSEIYRPLMFLLETLVSIPHINLINVLVEATRINMQVDTCIQLAFASNDSTLYLLLLHFFNLWKFDLNHSKLKEDYQNTWYWKYDEFFYHSNDQSSDEPTNNQVNQNIILQEPANEFWKLALNSSANCSKIELSRVLYNKDCSDLPKIIQNMTGPNKALLISNLFEFLYMECRLNTVDQCAFSIVQKKSQEIVDVISSIVDLPGDENNEGAVEDHVKCVSFAYNLINSNFVNWKKNYNTSDVRIILSYIGKLIELGNVNDLIVARNALLFLWNAPSVKKMYEFEPMCHLADCYEIVLQMETYILKNSPVNIAPINNAVEVKCLQPLHENSAHYSNLQELCRDLFLKIQNIELICHALETSSKEEFLIFSALTKAFFQHPVLHQFAITPREAILNNWTVQITVRPPDTIKVPLVNIHQLVVPKIMQDFMLRIKRLGWLSRKQFEEFWISFFGVLSLTPTGSEINEDNIDQINVSCDAIIILTEMLVLARPPSMNRSYSEYLQLTNIGDDESQGNKRILEKECLLALANVESHLYNNNLVSNMLKSEDFARFSPSAVNLDSLDISSSLRALFENFSHWFGKGYEHMPSYLLQQTIYSIGKLADLYNDPQFFQFSYAHMRNINHLCIFSPYLGYAVYAFLRSIPSVGVDILDSDKRGDLSTQVLSWLRLGLSSEWICVRLLTFNGIISLLKVGYLDILKPVYLYLSITLEKLFEEALKVISNDCTNFREENMEDGSSELDLMWTITLMLLEVGDLPEERKLNLLMKTVAKVYKCDNKYPIWVYRTMTNNILSHLRRSFEYYGFFQRLINDIFESYDRVFWSFKHILKVFVLLLFRDTLPASFTKYEKCLEEMMLIYRNCQPDDAKLISTVLPLILLQLQTPKSAFSLLFTLLSPHNTLLNNLTLQMMREFFQQVSSLSNVVKIRGELKRDLMDKLNSLENWPDQKNLETKLLITFSDHLRDRIFAIDLESRFTNEDWEYVRNLVLSH